MKKEEKEIKCLSNYYCSINDINKKKRVHKRIFIKKIVRNIAEFMNDIGKRYSLAFYRCNYRILSDNSYSYIDLLLYNIKYKCFVVIELKMTKLKKEHISQLEKYMNYIDTYVKTKDKNKTIGIIICRKDNKFILEYCSNKKILSKKK